MVKTICVARDIVPIARLKTHASRLVQSLRDHGRPLVITQNGTPAAVLILPDDFDRLSERERLVQAITEGLADAEAGRTVGHDELFAELEGMLDRAGDDAESP